MATIELKNIEKSYGKSLIVKGINLSIQDKEFVVFVGPSGCGKSTSLRMIAGLEEISQGDLMINGARMNDIPPKSRNIAMVFQNYALYPHMSVYENMAFSLKLNKKSKNEIEGSVKQAAEILGIESLLSRKPHELSGGQRQRVAMGRAIVRNPSAFLFDEPLSNLDAKLRTYMRAEIKKLHQKLGKTTIYVTHDQVEAMTLADRIVVMNEGRIEQVGKPEELYENPANTFVAGFLGSPPMNLVKAHVVNSKVKINNFELPLTVSDVPESTVTVGIRPECLGLRASSENSLEIKLDDCLVEPLGGEALLYGTIQGETLISRVSEKMDVKKSHIKSFFVDKKNIYLFDESGKTIKKGF